jgi:hypothetical protein
MTKKYIFERKFNLFVSIFAAVLFGAMVIFFATRPEFAVLNQGGSYAGIFVLIIVIIVLGFVSFFPIIVAVTGFLKLKDGVLFRTYLGIKIWSTPVSEITDIYRGNTAGSSYATQMWGLTFRTEIGEKHYWKQAPYVILDEGSLISDLTAINPKIQLHDNPEDLRKFWGMPL